MPSGCHGSTVLLFTERAGLKKKSKKLALTKRTEVIKTLAERRHCQQIDCDLSAIRSCIDYSEDN